MAKRILVMRHAEKSGDPQDPDLTPAGHQRAESLATFIPDRIGKPDYIFATSVSKHSARPYETVEPLAKSTGVLIDTTYADQDYGALAETICGDEKFEGKLIVVCWHHGNIPNFLHALQVPDGEYPDPWERDVFNLILVTTLADDATPTVVEIVEPF
jgi:broad specificity phosphatase PhoE